MFWRLAAALLAAGPTLAAEPSAALPDGMVAVHYHRPAGDYGGWGLHLWNEDRTLPGVTWERPLEPTGFDGFGAYWHVEERHFPDGRVRYIIHRGDTKEQCGKDMTWHVRKGREVWVLANDCALYFSRADAERARR